MPIDRHSARSQRDTRADYQPLYIETDCARRRVTVIGKRVTKNGRPFVTQRAVGQIRFLIFVAATMGLSAAVAFARTLWASF